MTTFRPGTRPADPGWNISDNFSFTTLRVAPCGMQQDSIMHRYWCFMHNSRATTKTMTSYDKTLHWRNTWHLIVILSSWRICGGFSWWAIHERLSSLGAISYSGVSSRTMAFSYASHALIINVNWSRALADVWSQRRTWQRQRAATQQTQIDDLRHNCETCAKFTRANVLAENRWNRQI